jgi:hypothetical protein
MDDMKAAMKRRALLCFGGQVILTTPFLAACTSAPCVSSNELDAARCREQAVKDSAPMYITGAMIIGAAVGAGIAIALRGDPYYGALGGALLLGGATATDRYLAYRLEQAHYDQALMIADVRANIRTDSGTSDVVLQDAELFANTRATALRNEDQRVFDNAKKADISQGGLDDVYKNAKTFNATANLYKDVARRTGLNTEPKVIDQVKRIQQNAKGVTLIYQGLPLPEVLREMDDGA